MATLDDFMAHGFDNLDSGDEEGSLDMKPYCLPIFR